MYVYMISVNKVQEASNQNQNQNVIIQATKGSCEKPVRYYSQSREVQS